jgi:hypothetical protein
MKIILYLRPNIHQNGSGRALCESPKNHVSTRIGVW